MDIVDKAEMIDRILVDAICNDLQNGSLLRADDNTLELLLKGIWEDISMFQARGVIIGET
tara:strand:+ start:541 stop:720 length:180 start_codon:yes stop_codon:yes gene_type:complete